MRDYSKAKIYKLINDDLPDKVYYGSTIQKYLCNRLTTHKRDSKKETMTSSELFKTGKVKIILVENYPCNSKEELYKRERFYIENNECINKVIPTRTRKEHYQDNKEEIIKKCKEWREKNKEKYKKYMSDRYLKNKDKIKDYVKQWKQKQKNTKN